MLVPSRNRPQYDQFYDQFKFITLTHFIDQSLIFCIIISTQKSFSSYEKIILKYFSQKKNKMATPEEIMNRLKLMKLHLEALLFRNDRIMTSGEVETASMTLDLVNQLIMWLQQNL